MATQTLSYFTVPISSMPGIQRDGTDFSSHNYIDGQWMRFYQGLPRKIGGYKIIDIGNSTLIRSLYSVPKANSVDTYLGRSDSLNYVNFNFDGVGGSEVNRTPTSYVPDINNSWVFDIFTNTTSPDDPLIVAQVAPNSNDVSNTTPGKVYYGDTTGAGQNLPLVPIVDALSNPILASGGIVNASPILISYGNNGFIQWSEEGQVTNWPVNNKATITNTKIIKMVRAKGSSSPQLLAWTLNSLISVIYNIIAGVTTFSYVPIQGTLSVMSPNSIVGYQQEFYWIGIDNFYYYNGIVNTLENTLSKDWFYNNVNLSQRSKVWGMAVPRYDEIWWFYPKGNALECTDVIIYNIKLKTWYDSSIGRAAGLSSDIFPLPMMSDTFPTSIITRSGVVTAYPLWMHEFGYDRVVDAQTISPIPSYFETKIYTLFESNPNANRLLRSRRIEPDFSQVGDMSVVVNNRMFPSDSIANGRLIQSGPYTFTKDTDKIDDINSQGRLVSFLFSSNDLRGTYQMGKPLLDYDLGDVQP